MTASSERRLPTVVMELGSFWRTGGRASTAMPAGWPPPGPFWGAAADGDGEAGEGPLLFPAQ